MGGGLMQLVAYGAQDIYLTGNPQITFFKVVYRRHTNFSQETVEHSFNGTVDFGRKASVEILRNGDLAIDMYLRVNLAAVVDSGTNSDARVNRFAYVRRLGYAMIDTVELDIGGSKIDKQYGDWMNIWYELTHPAGNERAHAEMIGDVPELYQLSSYKKGDTTKKMKEAHELFIPLYFWFNRNNGLALPLIALQYHEVRLHFEFKAAHLLVCSSGSDAVQIPSISSASLLVNYIFLDSQERRRFAQVGHEYLIEQLQFTGEASVGQMSNLKLDLNFNHPTKELIVATKHGDFVTGKKFLAYNPSDWNQAIDQAAVNIALGMLHLSATNPRIPVLNTTAPADAADNYTTIEVSDNVVDEEHAVTTSSGTHIIKITTANVTLLSDDNLYLHKNPLQIDSNTYFADKLDRITYIFGADDEVTGVSVVHRLTMRDLSRTVTNDNVTVDNRNAWVKNNRDVIVHQHHNYGLNLDGTVNPVNEMLLQLNGHDRFDKMSGRYFSYVQPNRYHSRSPTDGINVYSFALKPEQHQPSGSANLSRIDKSILSLWFTDGTATGSDTFSWRFLSSDTNVYVYAFSFNVLRVMSGMAGVAYSN